MLGLLLPNSLLPERQPRTVSTQALSIFLPQKRRLTQRPRWTIPLKASRVWSPSSSDQISKQRSGAKKTVSLDSPYRATRTLGLLLVLLFRKKFNIIHVLHSLFLLCTFRSSRAAACPVMWMQHTFLLRTLCINLKAFSILCISIHAFYRYSSK